VGDATTLALQVLGWVLADDRRAQRLLELTGLTPEVLRASLMEAGTHRAVLDFLCAHEPDLLDAAEALGVTPARLAGAREALTR
jgi:hypothetical protein